MNNKRKGISLIVLVISIIVVIILAGTAIANISKNNPINSAKIAKIVQERDSLNQASVLYLSKVYTSTLGNYTNKDIITGKVIEYGAIVTEENIVLNGMKLYVADSDAIKEIYGIKLPEVSSKDKARWYIDVKTGNFYLIYDSASDYEKYYGSYDEETEVLDNASLSTFIMTKKGFEWGEGMIPDASVIEVTMTNEWTNQDIELLLSNVPSDAEKVEYILPGQTEWNSYEEKIIVERNGTVNVRITNKYGNEDTKAILIDKIDKLDVLGVTFTPDTITDVKSVSITLFGIEDAEETEENGKSGVKEIKYQWSSYNTLISEDDVSWENAGTLINNGTIVKGGITETTYLHVLVEDNAGNKEVFVSGVYSIDNTAPDASNISATLDPNDWTNTDVDVTIDGIPEDAEIKQYTLPNSTKWEDYTGTFSVSENGTINVRVVDKAGNEATKTILIDKIDKVPPSKTTVDLNGYISGESTNTDVTQTFSATDDYSGILRYEYSHDKVSGGMEISNPWVINWDGQWDFYVRAVDKAGNVGEWSDMYTIIRDTSVPSKPSQPDLISDHDTGTSNTDNITKWYSNLTITGTAEANSYIHIYKNDEYYKDCYADASGNWSVSIDNNQNAWTYYKVYARDSAGNWSVESDKLGILSDTEAPSVPTITYNGGANTCSWKNNYDITLSSSDAQGIANYESDGSQEGDGIPDFAIMENPWIPSNGFNSCYQKFRAVDNAGNVSGWTEPQHIHMDTELPTFVNAWYGTPSNGEVSLYVQVSDNVGISSVKCPTSSESSSWTDWIWYETVWDSSANAYRADIKASDYGIYGNFKTHVYIYDNAGNEKGIPLETVIGSINIPNPHTHTDACYQNIYHEHITGCYEYVSGTCSSCSGTGKAGHAYYYAQYDESDNVCEHGDIEAYDVDQRCYNCSESSKLWLVTSGACSICNINTIIYSSMSSRCSAVACGTCGGDGISSTKKLTCGKTTSTVEGQELICGY